VTVMIKIYCEGNSLFSQFHLAVLSTFNVVS
jgi:hypothetical protein